MKTKLFFVLAALALSPARADMHPLILIPTVCTPTPPAPGQPGYGPLNPLPGGIYYNPDTGFWIVPESYWIFDGNDSDRDIAIVAIINDLLNPPPSRPEWAIFDVEPDGTYYWGGGYYNGHYYGAGYYLATEIA